MGGFGVFGPWAGILLDSAVEWFVMSGLAIVVTTLVDDPESDLGHLASQVDGLKEVPAAYYLEQDMSEG